MRCPFIITREMEQARARLEAYKNTIQPYPAELLQPEELEPVIIKKIYPYIRVDKKALELQKRIIAIENRLNERLDKKPQKKGYIHYQTEADKADTSDRDRRTQTD